MIGPIVVLGATGSIGTQTLDVAEQVDADVAVVVARAPSAALAEIAARFADAQVIVAGGATEEHADLARLIGREVRVGPEAILAAVAVEGRIVVNGIVGSAGLRATVAALEAGNRVALANKESLVAGGPVVMAAMGRGGGELIPVDSEHSALHQCLVGEPRSAVEKLILTASGGPFRGRTRESLADVTPAEALQHPTWDMGRRISIDSATMFNKGLEIIEAHHLFGVGYDQIEVVVHPQSIVHSAVAFIDGSWKAHMGHPDMRIPILYALTAPERGPSPGERFGLAGLQLDFEEADTVTFPAIEISYAAGRAGGSAPAALNAADEVAVEAFLHERLGFLGIAEVVERTIESVDWRELTTVDEVIDADREARECAASLISGAC